MVYSKLIRFGARSPALVCTRADVQERLRVLLTLPARNKQCIRVNPWIFAAVGRLFPGREVIFGDEEYSQIANINPSAFWRWYNLVKPTIDAGREFIPQTWTEIISERAKKARDARRKKSRVTKDLGVRVAASATVGHRTDGQVTRGIHERPSGRKTATKRSVGDYEFESVDPDTGEIVIHDMTEYDLEGERYLWANQKNFRDTIKVMIDSSNEEKARIRSWASSIP